MKRKSTFLRMFALLALLLPWTLQAQNAKVSEYDYEVTSAAYTSIASTGTAWTQADITAGYVDVTLPFAMYLGENQAAANSTVSVYPDGHVELNGLTGAEIAPLQYSSGYATTVTSIYYQQTATNEMTIEWRKVVANGNVLSFQLKLAADGTVKFCYGPMGMTSSIQVFVGIQADGYIFRVGGSSWDDITRYTQGTTTRALNSTNHPAYDINTGVGAVYTFTQPACVKPTAITATAIAWDTVQVGWTVAEAGIKYQVAYSTNPVFDADAANFPASQIVTVNDNAATSTKIGGLNSETTYYFAVRKYCDATTPSGWLYTTTGTTTPQSCPSPALSNFSLSASGVASWTLSSYPNIATVDIYYSTENVAPDAETPPSVPGIAVATGTYDLTTQDLTGATKYYVWFRGHCTVDGGNNTPWFGSINFTTPCSVQSLPYSEDFSSYSNLPTYPYYSPSVTPSCWDYYSNGVYTATSPSSNYYGGVSKYNGTTSYGSMVSNDQYLCLPIYLIGANVTSSTYIGYHNNRGDTKIAVLPQFDQPLNNIMISFKYKMTSTYSATGIAPRLELGYVTGNDATTFQAMQSWNATTTLQTINDFSLATLAASAPSGARLAFRYSGTHNGTSTSSYTQTYCGIDNIYVSVIPTCFRPSGLTVTDHTSSTVSLSWTDPNGASAWQIEYGPSGFTHGEGTIVNATTNSATIENLGLGDWDFYVRAVCSATDQSDWSNPATQHLGYCLPTCSSHDGQGLGGVSFGTSIIVNDETATTATTRYQDHTDMIGDVFAGDDLTVSILYKTGYTYGTIIWVDWNDDLDFDDAGEVVYRGTSQSTNPTTLTATITVPANATVGDHVMRIAGADSYFDSYVSNTSSTPNACFTATYSVCRDYTLRVNPAPSCFTPSNLASSNVTANSATLTWTERGLSTQWEIKYGHQGFNPDNEGNSVIVNTTASVTLNYLEAMTDYDAYVRAICNPEGPTDWVGACTFRTGCPNIQLGAATTMTIGEGTTTNTYIVGYEYYNYAYSQQIFTAAEMGTGARLSSLAVMPSYVNGQRDYKIYLGHVDVATSTSFLNPTDLTLVYDASVDGAVTMTADQWSTYTFSTPFDYNGADNLLVVFMDVTGSYNSGTHTAWYGTSGTSGVSRYAYRDGSSFTPGEQPTSSVNSSDFRTNIVWGYQPMQCINECVAPTVVIDGSQSGDFAVAELTFTDNSGEATPTFGYKCGLAGFDPTTVTGTTTTSTTASIGNLAGNTLYDLYVYAVCGGTDGNMVRYTFTTPMVYACKPQANFEASNVTYTSATVTWEQLDPNQTPESWTVRYADHQIADMSAAAATEYTESTVTTPTLALTGLHNGNTYYIYTKATCNALDASPDWTEFSFTTNTVMAPDAIAFSNVTNRTADMSWTDNNTPATNNYTVRYADHQIADIDNAAATEYTELTLTSTQYAFTMSNPLDPAAGYYVYVRANAGDEHSAWSVGTVNTLCPAPVEVAMGDHTSTTTYFPTQTCYNYSLTEQIFTVEELGGANTFSTLSYEVTTANSTNNRSVVIYMTETDKSSFASASTASEWISTDGLTPVYSGTMVTTETGWHTLTFDAPFVYSGNNNLVVIVDDNSGYYNCTANFGVVSSAVSNQTVYAYQDASDITYLNANSASSKGVSSLKSNFVFGGCDATVTCIPPKNVAAQVSTTNEVTLTWATREGLLPVPTNFEVRYDEASVAIDADHCTNVITDITALNATFSNGLVKNTNYVAYVASKCGDNDYSPWQRVTFTTNPTCWDPSALSASLVTANSVTLTWTNNATVPANRWQVSYAEGNLTDAEAGTMIDATTTEGTEITGLKHSTLHTFYVRAKCDDAGEDVGNWVGPYYTYTSCAAWTADDLPLNEDFTFYNGSTNLPACWMRAGSSTTYPNSTSGYLFFNNNSTNDLYAVMPQVSVAANTLDLVFDLYFNDDETLVIGVMDDPTDVSTFDAVETLSSDDFTLNQYNEGVTVQLENYLGTGGYIAFKVAGANTSAYTRIDNLTLKVREASHPLADAGETVALCDQYLIPTISDVTNTYSPNVNATYIVTPATLGKVLKLKGDYNLEYGYDFLDVYEGTDANATLVATLTGKGNYEYMTSSYDWATKGGFKLVFRTDDDNAMPNLNGFHFLATCECPEMVPGVEELAETFNGTYTWTAPNGDGNTYTHNVVLTGLTYGDPEETVDDIINTYPYIQPNVAGCDSIEKALTLTLHPTYSKTYDAEICQYETFSFYGNEYTATGTYTVNLTSKDGADSVGILNLQVHQAPTVAINYNGRAVTTVENFCDNADMALLARSNTAGATFVWDDNSTDANRVVNPHESNTYTVVATEPTYGCSSQTATLTVTTTPVPELSITATEPVICRGESTTLTLTDANNTAATYTWSNNQTGNSITVTPTETTTYTATATTTTGACVATAEFTVTVNQLPVVTAEASVSTICSDSIITLTATPVEGYSYLWNTGAATATATTVATATSDYTVTVTDANGCVNEFTTATVTVKPSYERNVTMDVCYTQNPYTWGAQQLTADGNYDQMFTAANGCDSLIHLAFTFQQMSVFNTPREVCEGTVLTWGPETVTATENTTVSYILNAGDIDPDNNVLECPAQYNLNLTVNHPAASSFERTVCDSTTWNVSGLTYTESGAYPYTLATTKGCDSVVTMNLTVNYHVFTEETVDHACDSYTWNTETYTEAGDYVQNFTGYQCDSTRTLHLLVVDNTTYGTDNILFCGDTASWIAGNTGYTWIDGVTYTMSETEGNITHTLAGANVNGCDSVSTLNLTLNPVAEVMNWANVSACDEYSIDTISCDGVRGTKYINQSGDYWFRTPTEVAGRDVLTRIHLTINRSTYHTNVVTACVPYEWKVLVGQDPETGDDSYYPVGTYNESTIVSFQMPDQYSANGCNRIEVLRLTALQPTVETTEATICQNGSWQSPDNAETYYGADFELGVNNAKTWYRGKNEAGCNLDKKVILTVNPVYNATAELTFCESEFTNNQLSVANALNSEDTPVVLTIEGALNQTPYTNTVTANWTTQDGCDSVVTITYTVNPTTYESVDFATCYKYTWDLNGETYEESGAYTYTNEGANSYHCDNVVTLNLTINDSVVENVTEYHCSDYEYEGVTYRTTETFREVLEPTAEGCEHVRYVTHTIIPTQMTDLYVVTNMPYTWTTGNGQTYTESTDAIYESQTITYPGSNNTATSCDSILMLHLTIVDDTAEFCENELPYNYQLMNVTLDGNSNSVATIYQMPMGFSDYLDNSVLLSHYGVASDVFTQWRSRLFADQHDGMRSVLGTQVHNYNSEYYTVELQVNGVSKATKTVHNLPSQEWIDIFFDTPVRISDDDVVDFIYSTTGSYAMLITLNGNGVYFPDNSQYRYNETDEWQPLTTYNYGNTTCGMNLQNWPIFGIDGYYYTGHDEVNHRDTILLYVVNPNLTETLNVTACDSYTWADGTGLTYTESGVYTYETTTVNGCDSTVTLNLTINVNSSETLDAVTACNSYDWTYQGNAAGTYTESGTYTHNFIDANGCASVATLPLTINNSVNETLEAVTACDSYEWNYNDVTVGTFTTSGDQVYNFTDANGCDGTVTLPLTINLSTEEDLNIVVNAASTYRNGNYYPASDTPYTFDSIGTNAAGCDVTYHVTLIVHQGTTQDVDVNACGEYTWETTNNGNGHTYQWISLAERQANGMALYKDITNPANPVYIHSGENPTFATYNNDQTVNTIYVLWLNLSEAGYQTVDLGNILLSQQNSLTVKGGNDSLDAQTIDLSDYIAAEQNATLNVQVRHNSPSGWYCGNIVTYTANLMWNYDTLDNVYVCNGQATYDWTEGDETFVETLTGDETTFTEIFAAGTANEMVKTVTVVRMPAIVPVDTAAVACDEFTWYGTTYTETPAVAPTHLFQVEHNGVLCDSTVTLNLTVNYSSSSVNDVAVCGTYTWEEKIVEGAAKVYTESNNTDTIMLTNNAGCDSIVTLNLTIYPVHADTVTAVACESYTWTVNTFNPATGLYDNVVVGTYTESSNNDEVEYVPTQNIDVVIGDSAATVGNSYLPAYSLYEYSLTQQIYTADEIGTSGDINSLTMWLQNTSSYARNWQIYMKEVDKSTFASGSDWVSLTDADLVASGTIPNGISSFVAKTFEFNTPFSYTGTGNLLVCVRDMTGDWSSGCYANNMAGNGSQAMYAYRDGTVYNPTTPGVNGTLLNSKNVIGLNITTGGGGAFMYNAKNQYGCDSLLTLNLTINNHVDTGVYDTACVSYTWVANNNAEYTASGDYTRDITDANGCAATETLHLTINTPEVFNREQYAYGNGITINGQFYEAPTTGVATYNVVLDTVDPEANNCPTVVNVTLYVSQYEYFYTNYVACGSYTWPVNNHTYRGLTDEEAAANPTALYFDETDNVAVTSNPMSTEGNRIDVLNLTINKPSVTNITRTVLMSQLEAGYTLTLEGNVEDFSAEYAAHQNATVTRSYSLGAHATCDSIVNYTINLVWNYDTVSATVCDVTSYTWTEANETFAVATGNNLYTHVFNAGTETEQVTTMKVTVLARTEDPQAPVTVCDTYTWHETEYTASANLEYNNDEACTHETLALTINTNAGTEETDAECFTYTWNVPTYELDATTNNYVAADDISNTYTEGGVKTVTFIDANGCQGTATLNLTIYADSTETLAAVTACDSYEWTYNNVVVNTYTEGGDKTYDWTDANGCAATATLPLTINNSASVNVEFWEGEGSYRYTGFFTAAPAQMLSASNTPYTFVETVAGATAEGCDSIYNITLHVGNYFYATETYRSCNSFTWERNNHTYVRLTDAQATDNPGALYFDETDNAMVLYNPTVNVPNEGTYDSVFMLQLTLDAIWSQTDVVNFPVSEGIYTYHGRNYDFSLADDDAGREFTDSTVTDTVHLVATTFCDSIYYVTINVYNNYREVETADICATTTSYSWRGQTINTTTSDYDNEHTYYIYDAINANDSVQYITITQHPVTYATERRTACGSYTWWVGEDSVGTYTASTTNETYATTDQYGCDYIVTLTLTINPEYDLVDTRDECDSYTWEGQTYTESTQDVRHYTTSKGCDSTMTLNLTINYNTNTVFTADECDTYTWTTTNGTEIIKTESGEFEYLYNTPAGCPSVDSLYLTIRNNSNQTIDKVVCDSYTWTAADGGNGETYTESNTYTYDYTATSGCPSTNTLNLTVNTNAGSSEDVTICDSYTWNVPTYVLNTATNLYELGDAISNTYTESGEKTVTYVDANGCEGTATLNLTINVNAGTVENIAECQSYTWPVNGVTYTTSGTYTEPIIDVNNCQGTATLNLTIGTMRTYVSQAVTNCGPYTWIVNDSTVGVFDQTTEASVYLPNSVTGCDSVVMLNLTVNPLNVTEETICGNGSYVWTVNNTTYTEAGTYDEVETDGNGNCLSTERLILAVNPVKETALTDQICLGNDYTANDFNIAAADIAAAGEYTFTRTLTSSLNCDSIVTLTLTVGDILTNVVEATACDSYAWNAGDGQTYNFTESGTYNSGAYANAMGCTTVDELTLTINQNSSTGYTESSCDAYMWNGTQYTESGDYTYSYTDNNNCESVDTLHLTIYNSVVNNIPVTACDSYTWENGDGQTYTVSGVYTYSYTTTTGCNGTDYLVLTINSNSNTEYTETVCDSYIWNGTEYNESGDYEYEYDAANGCPSKDILHLTVNNSTSSEETAENCNFYNWHGETYTTSGDYAYVSTNDAGCQHTTTLHLTINNPVTVTIDTTVCGYFNWNGISYSESDVITHSFTAANGCDSTEIINLTVNNVKQSIVMETACDSYTWDVNGQTYTEGGPYVEIIANASTNGCDSMITLVLTLNHSSNSSETVTACDSYEWNGQTYTTSGTQTYAYTATNGCASVDTLYLTINNSTTSEQTAAACNNYTWNGNVYIQSGDYTNVTTNNAGCADTAILHLTINTPVTNNITETTCNSYTWNGQTYSNSGIYTATFTAANGCDSIVNLMLTISAPVTNTVNATACDSYTWNGTAYNTTGTYTYNGTAANGCDSIVTLNLVINNSATNAISATACNSYTWNGATYTTTGSYTQTFTTTAGCDSVVTLALAISPAYQTEINQSACSSYTWNGTTYTTSGNYTSTFTAANGCDSVVTLNLTVTPTINMTVTATACDSYTWNNTNYTTSGNYTHTYTAAGGCDSVVTLALTVNNSTTGTATETVCDSYNWNGQTYTTSGTYTHNYTAANGCDSVVTLTLTVNNSIAVNTVQTVCDSYTWNGMMYIASGVYTQSFDAANGCDSTVTLTLTVNQSYNVVETVAECDSYIWDGGDGQNHTTSGTFSHTFTAENGCDSVITLNLTINHSVETYDTISILSTQLPYNYHGNNIPAEGDYVFNGTTVNGCDSTVYLKVNVQEVGIEVVNSLDDVTIYPNPTRGRVTVSAEDVVKIEVLDIVGRLVATFENTNTFDISNLGEGAYTLRITLPEGMTVRKVVKK